jgi:putative transposase
MRLWQLLLIGVAGLMNRKQQQVIEYLLEENRVRRELMGRQRLKISEAQKRRLAAKARGIRLGRLKEIARVVSPQTLIKWYRNLISGKYDGTRNRGPGRPLTGPDLEGLVIRLAKENRGWSYTRI